MSKDLKKISVGIFLLAIIFIIVYALFFNEKSRQYRYYNNVLNDYSNVIDQTKQPLRQIIKNQPNLTKGFVENGKLIPFNENSTISFDDLSTLGNVNITFLKDFDKSDCQQFIHDQKEKFVKIVINGSTYSEGNEDSICGRVDEKSRNFISVYKKIR